MAHEHQSILDTQDEMGYARTANIPVDGTDNGVVGNAVNGISDLLNGHGADEGTGKKGLKILIAGAGLGGLTAAIALRQQGHDVQVHVACLLSDHN